MAHVLVLFVFVVFALFVLFVVFVACRVRRTLLVLVFCSSRRVLVFGRSRLRAVVSLVSVVLAPFSLFAFDSCSP